MDDERRKSPPIAQGYKVTHERASLCGLLWLTQAESLHLSRKAMGSAMGSGRSEVSLERMGMRSCASARKPLGVGL